MGWWSDLFRKNAQSWIYSKLQSNVEKPTQASREISPDTEYLSVYLKSMRIIYSRKMFSSYYPTVHSYISIPHISGVPAKFNYLTTPGNLELTDPSHLDRVITMNKKLLDSVPYRGGDIEFELGLFSIKQANLAKDMIGLLSEMSDLAGVSFIKTALPYAKPLQKGIEILTGTSQNSTLEIGLSRTYDKIVTGHYVIITADKSEINANQLTFDKDFKLLYNGSEITNRHYIIFEITASPTREDFFNIPEISEAYKTINSFIRQRKVTDALDALTSLRIILYTCDDLLLEHAELIYSKIESETNKKAALLTATSDLNEITLPNLEELRVFQ